MEETNDCARKVELGNIIVENNMPLVKLLAKRIADRKRGTVDYDDIISEGTLGLIFAKNHYDGSRGIKFSSYASRCVSGFIKAYLHRRCGRVTARVAAASMELRQIVEQAELDHEELTVDSVYKRSKYCSRKFISEMLPKALEHQTLCSEMTVYSEQVSRPKSPFMRMYEKELCESHIKLLTDYAQTFIRLYYYENKNLAEIADKYNITRQAVWCVIHKAIKRMRRNAAKDELLEYTVQRKF